MSRLLLVLGLLALASPAGAKRYELDQLIGKVTADYPGVVSARETVASARAVLLQSDRLWMPTGDLNLAITGTPSVRCLPAENDKQYPNAGDPNGTSPDAIPQSYRESHCERTNVVDLAHGVNNGGVSLAAVAPIHGVLLNLSLTINQPLFSFGRIEANIRTAKANLAAAEEQLKHEQSEVAFSATRAYWGVKGARAAVDILTDAHKRLKERIDEVDDQLNGANKGKYTEGDLARLKIAQTNLDLLLLDQKRNLSFATHALHILSDDAQADVDEAELAVAETPLGDFDVWRDRAMRLRPEVRQQRAWADAARYTRELRLGEMLPELSATTTFGYGYASNMDTPQNWYMSRPSYLNAVFGLLLHQPLDLGVRYARYAQARHDEHAKAALVRVAEMNFSTELAQAWANYEEALARVEETNRGERVARGWNTAISEEVTPNGPELADATRNYFELRLRHLQAIVDANMALAALEHAAGQDWRDTKK